MTTSVSSSVPLWFGDGAWIDSEDYEPLKDVPHFKVTIVVSTPCHDGYCSDYDDDSLEVDYVNTTQCRSFPMDTWDLNDFKMRAFEYKCGCAGSAGGTYQSGYCDLPTRVRIASIEKFM